MEVAEKRGELVTRQDVVESAGHAVLTVRARLNAMVQKMTGRLQEVPGHVVNEELQEEVDDICNGFARGMSKTFQALVAPGDPCPFCSLKKPAAT